MLLSDYFKNKIPLKIGTIVNIDMAKYIIVRFNLDYIGVFSITDDLFYYDYLIPGKKEKYLCPFTKDELTEEDCRKLFDHLYDKVIVDSYVGQ